MNEQFSKEDILQRQYDWGNGIIHIGKIYTAKGDYVKAAKEHIDDLYGYDESKVLFKPTKATDPQFRASKEEALSYFVGGDDNYPKIWDLHFSPGKKCVLTYMVL